MARIYRLLVTLFWGLGLLSMLGGVALKLVPSLVERFRTEPRGGMIFAGVLFLAALATREVEKATSAAG